MLQVEKLLGRKGFECDYSGLGVWIIHRPDPAEGYAKRGYFNAAQTIKLATGNAGLVEEAISAFWANHLETAEYARYLTLRGERRGMATKKEKAEETAKKQITTKAIDGTEVQISPKQEEMLGQIKERSAGGSPIGSDDERLDDPSSIAAMKLATGEHPVVLRGKFGTRWHYFAKQADLDKATKAAEAAAEAAKKAKPAKAEKADKSETSGSAENNTQAAKGKKPLKKPSEK